ncbi:MAG TPA: site-specific DNA-methyltransferase [Polyangiaceae bacterium]|nr:site-specific DNA-methyltransferase [Polyangiaceae bacterium]
MGGSWCIEFGDCALLVNAIESPLHLVYMDPPFFKGETFKLRSGEVAFEDRWNSMHDFLDYVVSRAVLCFAKLVPGGSLVVHLDPTTSHHVKVALDAALDRKNFANEIIWRYRRWPTPQRAFQRMHDVLLRYVKPGAPPIFRQLYEPLSQSTIETWGHKRQRAILRENPRDSHARRARSSVGEEASPGAAMSDVWEIPIPAAASKERTGYPTQKPEKLLERLVLALTNEGNGVLDPMCGSGTTIAVAARLGRQAIGFDSSEIAVVTARARLDRMNAEVASITVKGRNRCASR